MVTNVNLTKRQALLSPPAFVAFYVINTEIYIDIYILVTCFPRSLHLSSKLGFLVTATATLMPSSTDLTSVSAHNTGLSKAIVVDLLRFDEQLSMITVASWFMLRDTDSVENAMGFAEDDVHFFQRAVGSLGIEKVNDGKNQGAVTMKICVSLAYEHRKSREGLV